MPDGRSACTHACMTVSRQAVTSSGLHACKPANRTESKPSCRRACMHAVRTVSQPASMTACQPAHFHGESSPKHCLGETSGDELLCERDSAHVLGGMPSQSFNCVESAVYGRRRRVLTGGWDPTRRAAGTPRSTIHLPVWSRVRGFLFFGFTRMGRDRRCPDWRGPCFGALRSREQGGSAGETRTKRTAGTAPAVQRREDGRDEALSVRKAGRASSSGRRSRPTRPRGRAGSRSTGCGG